MAVVKLLAVVILALMAASAVISGAANHVELEGGYRLDAARYGPGSLKIYQCPSQCNRRCGRTQYRKACLTFCNKCCRKCLCVPPGYYGNKYVCPCYNNWKTKRGGPKCP